MRDEYDFSSEARQGPAGGERPGTTRVTIRLDDEVIEYFRARGVENGAGYQSEINRALRDLVRSGSGALDARVREIVRDELAAAARAPKRSARKRSSRKAS